MGDNYSKLHQRSVELLELVQTYEAERVRGNLGFFQVNDLAARAAQLVHSVTGPKSPYVEQLRTATKLKSPVQQFMAVAGVAQAFHWDLAKGNLVNIRHEVEAVVISEILTQARRLLRAKGIHPAASVIVACAGAEEFLRNWCDEKGIKIPENRRSISLFATELRKAELIGLPVERRIQSWADYRNDAAHGDKWNAITPEIAERLVKEVEDFVLENSTVLG
jgi:hypothetical protein